jgi:hypothetical protein
MDQYRRQLVVDVLRHAGWPELADEASRVLPDPVDFNQLGAWAMKHGFTRDDLVSRLGGSP